ncbi:MAG TPA: DUF2012 domain-containing protein [Candidatus Kapabacteria bacterium]|nr:DUF2012 domain-containing protein [Candidatus Kapabacteria bacterium]
MNTQIRLLLLSAVALTAMSCHDSIPPAPAAHFAITGQVHTVAGTGLAGVRITAGSRGATTGSDGTYTLTDLPRGTYTLSATYSGYTFTPVSRTVIIDSTSGANADFTGILTIEMVSLPGGTFRMGATGASSKNEEKPAHNVTLSIRDRQVRADPGAMAHGDGEQSQLVPRRQQPCGDRKLV